MDILTFIIPTLLTILWINRKDIKTLWIAKRQRS